MAEVRDWKQFRDRWTDALHRQTGQNLAVWSARIRDAGLADEPSLRAWLSGQGITGYPQMLLVMERFGYPDFMTATADQLIEAQYRDRPHLKPAYEAVVAAALGLGSTVIQVRKTYVSLLTPRRTFARIQPTTRTRLDVALRLAGAEPGGRLARSRVHDDMPVQFSLTTANELDVEALALLKRAYDENC